MALTRLLIEGKTLVVKVQLNPTCAVRAHGELPNSSGAEHLTLTLVEKMVRHRREKILT